MTIAAKILNTFERQLAIMEKQDKTLELLCTGMMKLHIELKEVKELVVLQNADSGISETIH